MGGWGELFLALATFLHSVVVNTLYEPLQSGLRKQHNTETALLWVINDLLWSANSSAPSIITFLDLSSAFDLVNHDVLISFLSSVGISSQPLIGSGHILLTGNGLSH